MNTQISPLILSPPVLLNLVVRAVPLSDSDAAPGDQARVAQVVAPRRTVKKKKQTYKKD